MDGGTRRHSCNVASAIHIFQCRDFPGAHWLLLQPMSVLDSKAIVPDPQFACKKIRVPVPQQIPGGRSYPARMLQTAFGFRQGLSASSSITES